MKKILGLDLGTNSIGWAIREVNEKLKNQITTKGVLLFDKGVASDKGNEFPKVQKRTESRSKRRNYQAEKYRKYLLLEFLISRNMCPLSIEELNLWRKYTKGQKRTYPTSKAFMNWLAFDFDGDGKPDYHLFDKDKHESYYIFRAFAANKDYKTIFDNNPMILGRVFYQLVQRRGFKGRDEEEAETMLKGSEKNETAGRNSIEQHIKEHKTLGAALYYYQKETGKRIRKRYNLRKDYEQELQTICKVHDLNDNDSKKLWKAIIWQRPLRTQKGLIGLCTFEKNKKRVAISHPWYQEYKTWVFINNLNIVAPEGVSQEEYLHKNIYPFFIRKKEFKVEDIVKRILKDGATITSKYLNSKKLQQTKVVPLSNFYDFEKLFGNDWKQELGFNNIFNRDHQQSKKTTSQYTIEEIWHVLYTFDSTENLEKFAIEKLNFDEKSAKAFAKIKLNSGYATFGLSAVKKILPYLQKGINYSKAVYLANLPKVLGSDTVDPELVDYFIEEIDTVTRELKATKQLNSIVNSLIKEHLESKDRYFITDNRDLDTFEMNLIISKLENEIGANTWNDFSENKKDRDIKYVANHFKAFLQKNISEKKNLFLQQPRLHDKVFHILKDKYNLPEKNIQYLWHPSEQETYLKAELYHKFSFSNQEVFISDSKKDDFKVKNPTAIDEMISIELLGNPEPISKGFKNPMALKTLYKLKQLMNHLLKTHQIDEDTKVVIEIARELNNNNMRAAIATYQRFNEKENDKNKAIIEEFNEEQSKKLNSNDKKLLLRLKLWKEQKGFCLYTNKRIEKADVLNGNLYDIEHTIPQSMSFDSELKNLTLCETEYNRKTKGKKIPSQCPNYEEILDNVFFMKENIIKLEVALKANLNSTKSIQDKSQKDLMIQKRHLIKFELDYWRKKYQTFTTKEYKPQWKNSQLRDTQTVTKYALPYLKTVFRYVTVEKGTTVDKFKEIYNVKLDGKKDRTKHSHHAIDAAILTLIPNSYYREKLLEKYHTYDENKKSFHDKPKEWKNFKASLIQEIEKEVIGNNLVDDRRLTKTYKKVRKRGQVVYNDLAKKQPRIAKGDTIRGQLHKESFFGAIKEPQKEKNKILFDENNHMLLHDEIKLVVKKALKFKGTNDVEGFKNLAEIEKLIVDKALFKMIEKQVLEFPSFKEALLSEKGIWMIDKKGNPVNEIKKIRCFVSTKYQTAIKPHKHIMKSSKDYKQHTLSINAENAYCFYYASKAKNKTDKRIRTISLFDLSKLKLKNIEECYQIPYFNTFEEKNKIFNLIKVLKAGDKFIFFKDNIDELKDFSHKEILERLYVVYQFESDGRMKFKHHLLAGDLTVAKKKYPEKSSKNFIDYEPLLRIRQAQWNFAIENKDFKIDIDGKVHWLF